MTLHWYCGVVGKELSKAYMNKFIVGAASSVSIVLHGSLDIKVFSFPLQLQAYNLRLLHQETCFYIQVYLGRQYQLIEPRWCILLSQITKKKIKIQLAISPTECRH
jgi:hypothetical protein